MTPKDREKRNSLGVQSVVIFDIYRYNIMELT